MNQNTSEKNKFLSLVKNPVKFRLFMLKKLPAAFFAGLKIVYVSEKQCKVSVPFKYFTQNPFRSTYFACLSMAAEMSTGILAMSQVYKKQPSVSMLVVSVEGKFYKKATGVTTFICEDGEAMRDVVDAAMRGEPQTIRARSVGFDKDGDEIAEFWISWSFKVKR